MKGTALLWAAVGILAYSLLRKGQASKVAQSANAAPITVNADTDIIDEDKTGEALERLIGALDAQAKNAVDPSYTYFSFEGADGTMVSYRNRPYTRTIYDPLKKARVPFEP